MDASLSTFTNGTFAFTANGSATATLTYTAKDGAGNPVPNQPVTFTVSREVLSAGDPFVSSLPTDIASNGVESSVTTVQVTQLVDGNYIGIPGIPAASVVLAVSGSNNTITQPAAATDVTGSTTGSFVTTQASTTKTVSATVMGLALTATATVTTDGGYTPPAGGDPFFTENFTGPALHDDNGFVWGSNTHAAPGVVDTQDCLKMDFTSGSGSNNAEKRFNLGQNLTEVWFEFDLYVPANYAHTNLSPSNNKFFRLWGDDYGATNKVGASTWYNTGYASGSSMRWDRTTTSGIGPSAPVGGGATSPTWGYAVTPLGNWYQFRLHFRMESATNANDQLSEMWIDGVLMNSWSDQHQIYDTTRPYWNQGYVLGSANATFGVATTFGVDNWKVYNTDPGW